jgi:hypothetical protein
MNRLVAWGILLIGVGTGCATAPPRPTVHAYPARGQSAGQMSADVAHCEAWAKQQTGYDPVADTAKGAAVGTLLGGALGAGGGAAVGAASGGSVGRGAATGAVVGGVVGGVAGGAYQYSKSKEGYDKAYAACMSARGYATGANATPAAPPPPAPVAVASPPPAVVVAPPQIAVAPPPVIVAPPSLVVVPGTPVHYVPTASFNFFVYGNRYYSFNNGAWFVAAGQGAPWTIIAIESVPAPVRAVPVKHYKVPPGQAKKMDAHEGGWCPPGQAKKGRC